MYASVRDNLHCRRRDPLKTQKRLNQPLSLNDYRGRGNEGARGKRRTPMLTCDIFSDVDSTTEWKCTWIGTLPPLPSLTPFRNKSSCAHVTTNTGEFARRCEMQPVALVRFRGTRRDATECHWRSINVTRRIIKALKCRCFSNMAVSLVRSFVAVLQRSSWQLRIVPIARNTHPTLDHLLDSLESNLRAQRPLRLLGFRAGLYTSLGSSTTPVSRSGEIIASLRRPHSRLTFLPQDT